MLRKHQRFAGAALKTWKTMRYPYLEKKKDDCEETQPRMEAVEVGQGANITLFTRMFAGIQIVWIKYGF